MSRVTHSVLMLGLAIVLSVPFSVAKAQQETTAYAPVPGGQIEYVVSGPQDGETVVFIHGGGLADSFLPIMRDPVLARFQRVRVHRPQYMGSSDPADLENVNDVAAVIAVLETLNVERAHLVGHSSGALVALGVAQALRERAASLVYIDMGLGLTRSPEEVERIVRQTEQNQIERLSRRSGECDGDAELERSAYAEVIGDDWRDYFTSVPGGWEQAATDICRRSEVSGNSPPPDLDQLRKDLSRSQPPPAASSIDAPMLLLWGSDSHLAELLENQAQTLPIVSRGHEIANTDHGLIVQKPAEIALLISGWLGSNPIQ